MEEKLREFIETYREMAEESEEDYKNEKLDFMRGMYAGYSSAYKHTADRLERILESDGK